MPSLLLLASALVAASILYFLIRLYQVRSETRNLPGPPHHWLLGHIPIFAECVQKFPPDVHPHVYFDYIRRKYQISQPFFYLDAWPVGMKNLILLDPELDNRYASVKTSLPKSSWETEYIEQLVGKHNMVTAEGAEWKKMRVAFNPGFATSHLMDNMVGYIVELTEIFAEKLARKAETGEVFPLEEDATRLTFDIMGKIVIDTDFDSQTGDHPIVTQFRQLVKLMPAAAGPNPLTKINPLRSYRCWHKGRELANSIGKELDRCYTLRMEAEAKAKAKSTHVETNGTIEKEKKPRSRSVVDIAIDTYQKEFGTTGSSTKMDPTFRSLVIDQMKTFLFAGHDTTSSTLAYTFYELHRNPECAARLCAELDDVYGVNTSAKETGRQMRLDPHSINRLPYLMAVIKEILRLYPPASTLRDAPANHPERLVDPDSEDSASTSTSYPIAGFTVWPVLHAMNRNDAYWPSPESFIPSRHISSETPFPEARTHKDAWRPFEKGPRNCIGQELAVIETKVILGMVVREWDFVDEWPDVQQCGKELGVRGEKLEVVHGRRAYQVLAGAAKPKAGIPGRVVRRAR